MRFEAIPAKHYRNTVTKATASIYGAIPYVGNADKANWVIESTGWTIRDNHNNTVGFGLGKPFTSESEALQIAAEMECAAAAGVLRHWLPKSFPGKDFAILLNKSQPTGVLVLWRHAALPDEVKVVVDTHLESAGLEMASTLFSTDGRFARFYVVPDGAPYRERSGAKAA
ncbi:MAG: hypothetical protein EPN36_03580 [Rhodanobacteraceae bacterium]|nr:MAG: hypothetical protein EPN36_03580 [Rhodanobacteraceae bacterium]